MRRLRYTLRLILAFLLKFKGLLLVGVIIGILLFFITRLILPQLIPPPRERIGITGRYRANTLPIEVLELIGEGLTKTTDNGMVEPGLSSSWSSPDKGKTWVFQLKDDIYWQDGEGVSSSSVSYEFSDVAIERPDDKTIVFKLENPFSPFPSVVSRPTFKSGLLGTGEWKVKKVSIVAGFISRLTIENSNKEEKIIQFYPTSERTKLAYKLGEVDIIQDLHDPSPFSEWNTSQVQPTVNKDQVVVIFFNTQDSLLSDKSVRQALSYAIDKNSLSENRALSSISPNSWAYNPQVKPYDFDIKRSQELLKDFPKDKKIVKLATSPQLLATAEEVVKDWKELGFDATTQVSSIIPTEYQAFLTILDLPKDPDQYAIWHSTQTATNISKYSNPRIDKLLEDGRSVLDLEERRSLYLDFQRFLIEDSPAVFLHHPVYYTVSRK